ncbi:MAG: transporter [Gammaproteobacteria bacterium]
MQHSKLITYLLLAILTFASQAFAAPPFITDDAEPADYRQLQIYPYASTISQTHSTMVYMPSFEFDYGIIPHTEFHIIFTMATYLPEQGGNPALLKRATGIDDTEVNFKTRLLSETKYRPGIAIAPTLELPTGNSKRLLGNGRLWTKLPIWIQKNMGTWVTYGGGGYVFNSAPGMKNYLYGGWLLQKNFTEHFSFGGEIFSQGTAATHRDPPFQDEGSVTLLNLGAIYNVNNNNNFSISLGHSIIGTPQWVGYAGFYHSIQT